MFRCATVSEAELVRLRSIQEVVRLGRVRHIGPDRIELAGGSIPAGPRGRPRGLLGQPPAHRAGPPGVRLRPDHAAADPAPARQPVFSAALTGLRGGGPRRRRGQEPALPGEPLSGHGHGLDRRNLRRPAAPRWRGPLTMTCLRASATRLNATAGSATTSMTRCCNRRSPALFTSIEPAIAKPETFGRPRPAT